MERKRVVQSVYRVRAPEPLISHMGWQIIPAFGPVDRLLDPVIDNMVEQVREETDKWTRNG